MALLQNHPNDSTCMPGCRSSRVFSDAPGRLHQVPGPGPHLRFLAPCDEPPYGGLHAAPLERASDLEAYPPHMLHVPGVPHLVAEVRATQHRHPLANALRRRVPEPGHVRVPEHLL
uniref:Uncharacterized protein n=1 Tax=Triticum urartu TaxID=4572 RepID=A0A8R7QQY7_TRIUA